MNSGDHVKIKDGTGDVIEGVICKQLTQAGADSQFVVYAFEPGPIHDNPEKLSNMLVVPMMWLFVLKSNQYKVYNKPEVGELEYGVEKL